MTTTRTLAILALIALAPMILEAQAKVSNGYRLSPDASIRITVPAGRITVTGWERDSLEVTGTIPPGGGSWYGGGAATSAKMGIEGNDQASRPGATLAIRLPRRARVWIKTVTTSVEVTGLAGELDVLSVSGEITVRGAPPAIRLESLEGPITVDGDSSVARLRAGAGRVDARLRTGDLTVVSVNGPVRIELAHLLRARIETLDGEVDVGAALSPRGSVEVETHGGDVTVRLAPPVSAGFILSSVTGQAVVTLGGKPMRSAGRPLEFSTGDGTAQVTVRSFRGIITVTHR